MSFTPVIKALKASASTIVVQDITPTNGNGVTNGYGSAGGPTSRSSIQSLGLLFTPYGKATTFLKKVNSEINLDEIKLDSTYTDGVYGATVLYGMHYTDEFTASGNTIIFNEFNPVTFAAEMAGVTYFTAEDSTKVFKVLSKDVTTGIITFYDNVEELNGFFVHKMYEAKVNALVLSCGLTNLNQMIKDMALSIAPCEKSTDIMQYVLLKLSAQVAFNCGDYAKSDYAAKLLCGAPNVFVPCPNC